MILLLLLALVLTFGLWRWFRFTTCNLLYIATHPFRICRGKKRLGNFLNCCTDLLVVESWVNSSFRYKSDLIDYASWPLVFAMKWDKKGKWNGDCDDVASLAWYWAKRKNLRASYVSIIRPEPLPGHAVCLVCIGQSWHMVDSTGVVPFMGWDTHYPTCRIIVRKTR